MLYFVAESSTSTTWLSNWKLLSRHCTILKCCSSTTCRCMVQPLLQDHPTNTWGWDTCLVPQVQGLASRRCSNLHGHHSFSRQQHRWRVLSHQGLHFRLISDSSFPLMQYQGNLIMHPVCHSHSLFCQLALVLKRRGQTHSSLIILNRPYIQHSKGICYYEILASENYMPAFDNFVLSVSFGAETQRTKSF